MAEGNAPRYVTIEEINYVTARFKWTSNDFTSWSFKVTHTPSVGIFMGFAELWVFSFDENVGTIDAKQISLLRDQNPRNFSFSFDKTTMTVTVTCSSVCWGGAVAIV